MPRRLPSLVSPHLALAIPAIVALVTAGLAACGPGPTIVSNASEALDPRPGPTTSASASAVPSAVPSASASASPDKPKLTVAVPSPDEPLPPFSCAGQLLEVSGSTFCAYTERRTWSDAERNCEQHGGRLATIRNEALTSALQEAIGGAAKVNDIWIGLVEPAEGRWLWSNAKPVRFAAWNDGEPNDSDQGEDCGEFIVKSGRWNDAGCFVAFPFLCEGPPQKGSGGLQCKTGKRFSGAKSDYCLNGPATWDVAQKTCVKSGGDLAVLDTQEENDAVFRLLGPKLAADSLWIGLNDRASEGQFGWITGEALGQTLFRSGEPNNIGDEDCIEWAPSDGRWNDLSCGEERASICEKPVPAAAK